jgi:hypothetical protein
VEDDRVRVRRLDAPDGLRLAEGSFSFTDGLDPTGEYLTFSWAIESNLLVRTLLGYDHVAGPAGNKLVLDIATAQILDLHARALPARR